jgi:hypothetical protein
MEATFDRMLGDDAKAQGIPHLVALLTLAGVPIMKESLTIKAYELLIEHLEKKVKEMDDDQMNQTLIYHTAIKLYEETLFRVCGYESLMKLATEADKRIEKEFGKKNFGFAEGVHENFQYRNRSTQP